MGTLASPFAGLVSDRVGRRPMIVTALGGIGAMFLLASTAQSFGALLAVRFVAGILGSCGPTSLMASVGDLELSQEHVSAGTTELFHCPRELARSAQVLEARARSASARLPRLSTLHSSG